MPQFNIRILLLTTAALALLFAIFRRSGWPNLGTSLICGLIGLVAWLSWWEIIWPAIQGDRTRKD